MALLELDAVCKTYRDSGVETPVLKGVNLRLAQGELAAITGPSGCGKSTLMHLIATLDEPTAGHIRFQGRDLGTLTQRERDLFRNTQLGFVYQFHHLLQDFSALENVMMPLLISGMHRAQARHAAMHFLERVGLSRQHQLRPPELSGGQRQRVAIARALCHRPALVLADEPTGNLDEDNARSVFALFCELVRAEGTTVILVTHDRSLAAQCDRCLTIHNGSIG